MEEMVSGREGQMERGGRGRELRRDGKGDRTQERMGKGR
jgi:hypothetical protein